VKEENASMSTEESRYRQESADELVVTREVTHGSPRLTVEPAHTESTTSRGASPLATWVRVISIVLAVVEGLIAIRFVLKLLAANPEAGFARLIDGATAPLVAPFVGLLGNPASSAGNQVEVASLVAMAVYALVAWLLTRIVQLVLNRTVTSSRRDFS
jgi:YGGT family